MLLTAHWPAERIGPQTVAPMLLHFHIYNEHIVLIISAKYVWSIGLYEGKTYTLVAGENSFLTLEIVVWKLK